MLEMYKKSELELWIEGKYKEKGIYSPSDLDIDVIAKEFNIEIRLSKGPERAIWDDDNEIYMIFIKPNHTIKSKRKVFFHELCHPLRHYGTQESMLNNTLRELQEDQAHQFEIYAAMPFYMINNLVDLPNSESELIERLSRDFNVPMSMAHRRVKQIKQKIMQAQLDKQFTELLKNEKVFNYCKNIETKKIPKHAEDIVALAISRKIAKESVTL